MFDTVMSEFTFFADLSLQTVCAVITLLLWNVTDNSWGERLTLNQMLGHPLGVDPDRTLVLHTCTALPLLLLECT